MTTVFNYYEKTQSNSFVTKKIPGTECGYTKSKQLEHLSKLRELKQDFEETWNINKNCSHTGTASDFEIIKLIEKGVFGRVYLAKKVNSTSYYAMRVSAMKQITHNRHFNYCMSNMKIVYSLNFPFINTMNFYFEDDAYLYFVEAFIEGGDFFTLRNKTGRLEETVAKFFVAQVVLALEYLHVCNLIHRDLKPENVLLKNNGYIKLTNFNYCKLVNNRTYTLCGTPGYLAPEMILIQGYGHSVDWWSLGVFLFELTAGYEPFYANEQMQVFENITSAKYRTPEHFSDDLKDLIDGLLQVDASKRLGNLKDGAFDIKRHKWFVNIDWDKIMKEEAKSPLTSQATFDFDTTCFDGSYEVPFKEQSHCSFVKDFIDF